MILLNRSLRTRAHRPRPRPVARDRSIQQGRSAFCPTTRRHQADSRTPSTRALDFSSCPSSACFASNERKLQPGHSSGGGQPARSGRPATNTRRPERKLAHAAESREQLQPSLVVEGRGPEVERPHESDRPLDGLLHHRGRSVTEGGLGNDRLQHSLDVPLTPVRRCELRNCRRGAAVSGRPAGTRAGRSRNPPTRASPVPGRRTPSHRSRRSSRRVFLGSGVMPCGDEGRLRRSTPYGPASQCTGAFEDIFFGSSCPMPEREEFEELASQVLVRRAFAVVVAVEPADQRGVGDQPVGKVGEAAAGVASGSLILREHQPADSAPSDHWSRNAHARTTSTAQSRPRPSPLPRQPSDRATTRPASPLARPEPCSPPSWPPSPLLPGLLPFALLFSGMAGCGRAGGGVRPVSAAVLSSRRALHRTQHPIPRPRPEPQPVLQPPHGSAFRDLTHTPDPDQPAPRSPRLTADLQPTHSPRGQDLRGEGELRQCVHEGGEFW